MLRLAGTGLTAPAVAGRGLSEGLGRTLVAVRETQEAWRLVQDHPSVEPQEREPDGNSCPVKLAEALEASCAECVQNRWTDGCRDQSGVREHESEQDGRKFNLSAGGIDSLHEREWGNKKNCESRCKQEALE